MAEPEFAPWLARKSWREAVRFCRVVAFLLPFVIAFVDVPLLLDPARRGNLVSLGLVAWHVVAEIFCLGIVWAGRAGRSSLRPERDLAVATTGILLLAAAVGALTWLRQGDVSLYALGTVFVATMLCTPRHYRRPLYALGLALVALPAIMLYESPAKLFIDLLHPACVAVVAWQLDKYMYAQNLGLFNEMQRAEQERERADKVLFNVFPTSIANELKRDEKVNAVKFDQMGVMFADIVGFTRFSGELPPQTLVIVLDEIFSRFDRLVERYGLEKIKTIGDAYMAVSHRDTDKLVLLALDTLESMRSYNLQNGSDLQLRIGIHVGPAVAGVIGVKRFLYDVWGDTVNVASRMESGGEPGQVHVTEAVYHQLRDRFEFEQRPASDVKGKGTMTTYFVRRRQPGTNLPQPARSEAAEAL